MNFKKKIFQFLNYILNAVENYRLNSEIESLRKLENVFIHDSFHREDRSTKISIFGKFNKISISQNVSCRRFCSFVLSEGASLEIENDVFFNNGCSINCLDYIKIGSNTQFGENVKLYDHNHSYDINPIVSVHRSVFSKSSITIGKNCWIGSNVTILKGVTIGDNVIIGANCLIYKSIPSNSIVKNKAEIIIEQKGIIN